MFRSPNWARGLVLCAVLSSIGPPRTDGGTQGPVVDPLTRGLGYLAGAWQGDGYDDAYLQYVYPDERLECPLDGCRLTYRLLDAYINLAFLERAGLARGPARAQFLRGRKVLDALVPLWREKGLYNVTRAPQKGGVALDTYCIVGLLYEDPAMARVVAGHLDGEAWLAEDFYDPQQSFRKLADESWCIGLLAVAGDDPALVARLVRASVKRARESLGESLSAEVRANIALHLVYLLMRADAPAFEEELAYFIEQLDHAARDPALQSDLLTQANILEALARSGRVDLARLSPIAKILLANQEPDGGWHSRIGERGSSLRVFTSLRALLALKRYRDLGASSPSADGAPRSAPHNRSTLHTRTGPNPS